MMSLHSDTKHPCEHHSTQLWAKKMMQNEIEDGYFQEISPLSTLDGASTIEFSIHSDGHSATQFNFTYLLVEMGIVKSDGTAIGADEKVAFVNNTLHSAFSSVSFSINNTLVTSPDDNYHVLAYMENLVTYGTHAMNQLELVGWAKDTADKFDSPGDDNAGFTKRQAWTSGGKKRSFMGTLHIPVTTSSCIYPNGLSYHLKLVKNNNALIIQQPADNATAYKVNITKASLFVRKVKLTDTALLKIESSLRTKGPAIIPVRRADIKVYTIPRNQQSYFIENFAPGDRDQLPEFILIGFIDNEAYNGHKTKNWQTFDNHKLNFLQIQRNGQQYPSSALKPTYGDNGEWLRAYFGLYEALGKLNSDESLMFTRDEYPDGYCLYAFNFTPDLNDGDISQPGKAGDMKLEIRFGANLTKAVNIVVYSLYDSTIQVDHNRSVFLDYTP